MSSENFLDENREISLGKGHIGEIFYAMWNVFGWTPLLLASWKRKSWLRPDIPAFAVHIHTRPHFL